MIQRQKTLDPRDCDLHVRPDHRTLSTVLELHFRDIYRQSKRRITKTPGAFLYPCFFGVQIGSFTAGPSR